MLDRQLSEGDLDTLYGWVDTLSLSRPKKHINRDFSDGVMMAETISNFFPKIVQIHNYPAANSLNAKIANWKTLSTKSLSKLGLSLKSQDCQKLASASPLAIEVLLFQFMKICMQEEINQQQAHQQQERIPTGGYPAEKHSERQIGREKTEISSRRQQGQGQQNPNRVQELKEVLKLIKDKINSVQKSIQRKDGQIKQLEQIIQMIS